MPVNKANVRKFGAMAAILLLGLADTAPAEIYKTVDKDGNVIYTDQPPSPGATPMELPGLSVVEAPPFGPSPGATEGQESGPDIRALRRMYRDFAISRPAQDEYIEGTGNRVTVGWGSRQPWQPGMKVVPTLDGKELPAVMARMITLDQVDRGEHVISARLIDANDRTVATAPPVTFHMRQFSVNFRNTPQPSPGGG